MRQDDRFLVINIREYLRKNDDGEEQFGEDDLRQILAEFSCGKNQDGKQGITAPFLRLAAARRLKLHTTFVMDNHRT